ncbi:ANK-REP-REGION domain-containing protein [Mycena sanguinolenta]|uniref:ANK-REP-REGION domain-containing protein n=1 Tax=Mycena sanguinolenta TaxID=230812 RepID=A0A8H6ZJX4_9AGAR|nr:ANK-REP-REGION domain-containing protein [Mycena sanguinolenta]
MSSPSSLPNVEPTYGALLIGAFVAMFFQGILSVQAFIYYENFPHDSRKMKALVATVWTLDLVQLVFICHAVYHYLARNWGNVDVLATTTVALDLHLIPLTCATLLCQGFFLLRVWKFSKKLILSLFLGAACLSTGIIDIVMAIQTISNPSLNTVLSHMFSAEVISVFAVGAAADLSIAAILCWYLRRELTEFDRINSLIGRLIQYTVATGLVTSLLALGCLIAYVGAPNGLIFMAMHFSLGRMYTNALLATLNSRKILRTQLAPPSNLQWTRTNVPSMPAFARRSEVATELNQDIQLKTVEDRDDISSSSKRGFESAV